MRRYTLTNRAIAILLSAILLIGSASAFYENGENGLSFGVFLTDTTTTLDDECDDLNGQKQSGGDDCEDDCECEGYSNNDPSGPGESGGYGCECEDECEGNCGCGCGSNNGPPVGYGCECGDDCECEGDCECGANNGSPVGYGCECGDDCECEDDCECNSNNDPNNPCDCEGEEDCPYCECEEYCPCCEYIADCPHCECGEDCQCCECGEDCQCCEYEADCPCCKCEENCRELPEFYVNFDMYSYEELVEAFSTEDYEYFTVEFYHSGQGTLTANGYCADVYGEIEVREGRPVEFIAIPNSGFTVRNWSISEGTLTNADNARTRSITSLSGDVRVSVTFHQPVSPLTYHSSDHDPPGYILMAQHGDEFGEPFISGENVRADDPIFFTADEDALAGQYARWHTVCPTSRTPIIPPEYGSTFTLTMPPEPAHVYITPVPGHIVTFNSVGATASGSQMRASYTWVGGTDINLISGRPAPESAYVTFTAPTPYDLSSFYAYEWVVRLAPNADPLYTRIVHEYANNRFTFPVDTAAGGLRAPIDVTVTLVRGFTVVPIVNLPAGTGLSGDISVYPPSTRPLQQLWPEGADLVLTASANFIIFDYGWSATPAPPITPNQHQIEGETFTITYLNANTTVTAAMVQGFDVFIGVGTGEPGTLSARADPPFRLPEPTPITTSGARTHAVARAGSTITFTAAADNRDYHFPGTWTVTGATNPGVGAFGFTVDSLISPIDVSVNFTEGHTVTFGPALEYERGHVTATAQRPGAATPLPTDIISGTRVQPGSTVEFRVTENPGSFFSGWSVQSPPTASPFHPSPIADVYRRANIAGDIHVQAGFTPGHIVTFSVDDAIHPGRGTIEAEVDPKSIPLATGDGYTIPPETAVTFTAEPLSPSTWQPFGVEWRVNESAPEFTKFTSTDPNTLDPNTFEIPRRELGESTLGGGRTNVVARFIHGVDVTFAVATPTFTHPYANRGGLTATAEIGEAPPTPITSSQRVHEDATVTFMADPDPGHRVSQWMVSTNDDTDYVETPLDVGNRNRLILGPEHMQSNSVSVRVYFEEVRHIVTFTSSVGDNIGAGGTISAAHGIPPLPPIISIEASGDSVPDSSTVEFTARPTLGYRVREWVVDDLSTERNTAVGRVETLRVDDLYDDITVHVYFEALTFDIIDPAPDPINQTHTLRIRSHGDFCVHVYGNAEGLINHAFITNTLPEGLTINPHNYTDDYIRITAERRLTYTDNRIITIDLIREGVRARLIINLDLPSFGVDPNPITITNVNAGTFLPGATLVHTITITGDMEGGIEIVEPTPRELNIGDLVQYPPGTWTFTVGADRPGAAPLVTPNDSPHIITVRRGDDIGGFLYTELEVHLNIMPYPRINSIEPVLRNISANLTPNPYTLHVPFTITGDFLNSHEVNNNVFSIIDRYGYVDVGHPSDPHWIGVRRTIYPADVVVAADGESATVNVTFFVRPNVGDNVIERRIEGVPILEMNPDRPNRINFGPNFGPGTATIIQSGPMSLSPNPVSIVYRQEGIPNNLTPPPRVDVDVDGVPTAPVQLSIVEPLPRGFSRCTITSTPSNIVIERDGNSEWYMTISVEGDWEQVVGGENNYILVTANELAMGENEISIGRDNPFEIEVSQMLAVGPVKATLAITAYLTPPPLTISPAEVTINNANREAHVNVGTRPVNPPKLLDIIYLTDGFEVVDPPINEAGPIIITRSGSGAADGGMVSITVDGQRIIVTGEPPTGQDEFLFNVRLEVGQGNSDPTELTVNVNLQPPITLYPSCVEIRNNALRHDVTVGGDVTDGDIILTPHFNASSNFEHILPSNADGSITIRSTDPNVGDGFRITASVDQTNGIITVNSTPLIGGTANVVGDFTIRVTRYGHPNYSADLAVDVNLTPINVILYPNPVRIDDDDRTAIAYVRGTATGRIDYDALGLPDGVEVYSVTETAPVNGATGIIIIKGERPAFNQQPIVYEPPNDAYVIVTREEAPERLGVSINLTPVVPVLDVAIFHPDCPEISLVEGDTAELRADVIAKVDGEIVDVTGYLQFQWFKGDNPIDDPKIGADILHIPGDLPGGVNLALGTHTFHVVVSVPVAPGIDAVTSVPVTVRVGIPPRIARLTDHGALQYSQPERRITGFTVTGYPAPDPDSDEFTVTIDYPNYGITWQWDDELDGLGRIDIPLGLPVGEYIITLIADNGISPHYRFVFTLTVDYDEPDVTWPQSLTAIFGETLGDVPLPARNVGTPGTFTWTEGAATPVGDVGTQPHNLTFTPDLPNFRVVPRDVNVEVSPAPIEEVGLQVVAPVTDVAPATTVTILPLPNYEGFKVSTVRWDPIHNPFEADTVYKVYITLTAEPQPIPNHTFTPDTGATINGEVATIASLCVEGKYIIISVIFPRTDLFQIKLTTPGSPGPNGLLDFDSLRFGEEPPPQTIRIANTGNQPTGEFVVNLDGDNAFEMREKDGVQPFSGSVSIDCIDLDSHIEIIVRPRENLDVDTYNATITVGRPQPPTSGLPLIKMDEDGHRYVDVKFEVTPVYIGDTDITELVTVTYTGTEHTPTPELIWLGIPLVYRTDFELDFADNTNAGTAIVTITGINNFHGSITRNFTINRKQISGDLMVTATTPPGTELEVTHTLRADTTDIPGDFGNTVEWFVGPDRNSMTTRAFTSTSTPGPLFDFELSRSLTLLAYGTHIIARVTGTGNFIGTIESYPPLVIGRILIGGPISIIRTQPGDTALGSILSLNRGDDPLIPYPLIPYNADVTYRWRRGNVVLGTDPTHTIRHADLNSTITLEISGTGRYTGWLSADINIPSGPPSAPRNFVATPGDTYVALSWIAPEFDGEGGNAALRYEVSIDGATWIPAANDTGHTFDGLTNGTLYTFWVRAVNAADYYGDHVTATATPMSPDLTPPPPTPTPSSPSSSTSTSTPPTPMPMPSSTQLFQVTILNSPTPNGDAAAPIGQSYSERMFEAGALVPLIAGDRDGFVFNNWSTAAPGVAFDSANAAITDFIMPAKDVVIFANWTPRTSFSVTIVNSPNGNSVPVGQSDSVRIYEAGMPVSLVAGTRDGFAFSDWDTNSQEVVFNSANTAVTSFTMPPSDVIITANWTLLEPPPSASFSVTILNSPNGDSIPSGQSDSIRTFEEGTPVPLVAGTRDGFAFSDWDTNSQEVVFNSANTAVTSFTMPPADVIITANWTQLEPPLAPSIPGDEGDSSAAGPGDAYIPIDDTASEAGFRWWIVGHIAALGAIAAWWSISAGATGKKRTLRHNSHKAASAAD